MSKLLSTREMEIIKAGASAICNANHEMTFEDAVEEIVWRVSFTIDEDDIAELLEEVYGS